MISLMNPRPILTAAVILGFLGSAGPARSQDTARDTPREVPEEMIMAVLTYLQKNGSISVATDGIEYQPSLVRLVRRLGLPTGAKRDLLACTEDRRSCKIATATERIVNFLSIQGSDNHYEVGVIVSTEVKVPGSRPRVFPTARQLTVTRNAKAWTVVNDAVGVKG